jgi:diguanylate cyclase (GGDEF)-like protein
VIVPMILGLNCLMHVAGILAGPGLGVTLPPLLLTLQLSFMLLLSAVLLRHAIPMAAVALALYVVAEWQISTDGFPAELAFMLFANCVLGSVACYALERSERVAWLHSRRFLELSERDQLTGLHNRRFLDEHGAKLLRQGFRERKPVTALFIDIDFFKNYNDALGHLKGDEALQDVAEVLAQYARRPLDLVCRAGGEEFVILLYDNGLEAGAKRAEEVRMAIEKLAIVHPKAPLGHVTVSIGLASTNANEIELKDLLDAADQGLYEAKKGGRNRVYRNETFSERIAA